MHFSDEVFENIQRIFNRSNRKMNELTRNQALVPDNCTVVQNRVGTAPCTWFERDNRVLVSMPGVPSEMKWLMSNEIIPRLKTRFNQNLFIRHQTCWVAGFTESALAIKLTDFEKQLPSFVKLAYLPQPGLIRLRLSAYAEKEEEAIVAIAEQREKLHGIEYVILDEGWSVNKKADLMQVIPEINIKELVDYGKSKNVGIILWAGFHAFDRDMENVCKHYAELGVKGFKIDFMDRDDQEVINFLYRAAETCAKYKLMADFHGICKPAGLTRTYPNVINFEAVHGKITGNFIELISLCAVCLIE